MVDRQALTALVTSMFDPNVETAERRRYQTVAADAAVVAALDPGEFHPADKVALGIEAIDSAKALLARGEEDEVITGIAYEVWNRMTERRPGPAVDQPLAVARIDLVGRVPELLVIEAEWREAAKVDTLLESALRYWDGADAVDVNAPAWATVLDAIEPTLPGISSVRAELSVACVVSVPGPVQSVLEAHGVAEATFADVREIVATLVQGS